MRRGPGAFADEPGRRAQLRTRAEQVLRANWREGRRADGVQYGFTCPATPRYRHQWYWDSCFHAIAWRHLEPARARTELRTLMAAGRLDGFIPHTAFWDKPAGWRRAPLYGTHSIWRNEVSATISTPLLAMAWELVAASSTDEPSFAQEGIGQLRLHYDWLAHERDVDGDGLITTILPDESGLDDSPKYDLLYGRMAHYKFGHTLLVERYRRLGYDAHRIAARYDEHVEDVVVNTFYALALQALARLDDEHGSVYARRAAQVERSLMERSWNEERGLFFDLAGRDDRQLECSTWSCLAPLALPGIPEAVKRRLVEEHLLDPRRYRAAYGIPSVSQEEPSFNPGFQVFKCWRGPSWVNTAWLLVPAIRALGYTEYADSVVESLQRAVLRHGYREYYNPITGRGLAASGFGWSTLMIDIPPAENSRSAGTIEASAPVPMMDEQ